MHFNLASALVLLVSLAAPGGVLCAKANTNVNADATIIDAADVYITVAALQLLFSPSPGVLTIRIPSSPAASDGTLDTSSAVSVEFSQSEGSNAVIAVLAFN